MYIQVRTVDVKTKIMLDISKTATILELKNLLVPHFGIKPEKQRLFFRGKQLEDEYTLFDYSINLNDMVQIMEKITIAPASTDNLNESKAGTSTDTSTSDKLCYPESVEQSQYFKVKEFVDFRDLAFGAWFEGTIIRIRRDFDYEQNKEVFKDDEASGWPHDGYFYQIKYFERDVEKTLETRLVNIRPRARDKIPFEELKISDFVLANYNVEDPSKKGFWYECIVTDLKADFIIVDIIISPIVSVTNCKILFTNDVMKIEEPKLVTEREINTEEEPPPREIGICCEYCDNSPKSKCKECGCHICGLKTEENKQIMCDECDHAYHIWCLNPPLEQIPDDEEWYCHLCKNDENEIVSAGGKLKESKKKAKMASKQNNSSRDWGKGMACVARTKVCTIVPFDHFGPIPGIEVGTLWKFRIQASEAGVHRPHVAGIHGRENIGAFSVVLSGGYEDDVDNGDEVYYTGSGGRDLSGNKRTNAQCFDQTLTRFNKALAMNCNAPLNKNGAEAKFWRAGKPVRVIRNYKLAKRSKYAPEEGNRYDGIYKVVKYFPKKGKSGYTVWCFLFRRDDPAPAPWTVKGKQRIEALGLEMQYPEGYLEALEANKKVKDSDNDSETPKSKGKGKKRVLEESPTRQPQAAVKKSKLVKYELENDVLLAIQKDFDNEKLWDECKKELSSGKLKFLAKVEEMFTCLCCTELVFEPVTTSCHHNFCAACLKRSFKAEVMTCPTCRNALEEERLKNINAALQDALLLLFPGYTASR